MSNKETKVRVANAFRAMKAIGIFEDKVKPVLKDLLKLYDKNWAYIEEENYRVLADTIFERDEAEAVECSKKNVDSEAAEHSKNIVHSEVGGPVFHKEDYLEEEAQATEEPERPLKRLRRKYRDGQSSSLNAPETSVPSLTLVTPKEEPNELPETCLPNISDGKSKGVQSISPQTLSREKSLVPVSSSHAVCLKEPNVEPLVVLTPKRKSVASHALIKPKDDPITDDMPPLAVPIAVIHPDPSNGGNSSSRSGTIREHEPSVSLSVNENEKNDDTAAPNEPRNKGELTMITGQCSNLQIASLPFGEVKISLTCDLALGRPDFHMPNRETVLQLVEEKCLRSYKNLDPNFSVMNLMKEMCQGFLKSGSDLSSELPASINRTPTIDLSNKSSATGSCVGFLNDSVDSQFDAEATLPNTLLLLPPCAVDGSHLKKMDGGDEHPETNLEKEENCAEEMNLSLVVYKQPNVTPEMMRSLHDIVDIANGQEEFVITLVNEVNDECPPFFYYIPKNAVFRNAYVNFSLACIGDNNCCSTCSGDCLSLSKSPCACARESGGEFVYTPDGLVKVEFLEECISMNRDPKKNCRFFCKECPQERAKGGHNIEPCKGHLMRKFIKECWWKCGCDKQCGNRVAQRGISCNLQVFMTPEGKGWGLRTLADLPKGAFVCEYVGEILTNSELYDRVLRCPKGEKNSCPVLLDADWGAEGVLKDEQALCLDATYYGNVGRFINHRCYDSNLVEIPVEVETPDRHYYHLAFFTTRKVNAMEELTWDYGIDFDDHDHPIKVFHCECGSKFCRYMKHSRN